MPVKKRKKAAGWRTSKVTGIQEQNGLFGVRVTLSQGSRKRFRFVHIAQAIAFRDEIYEKMGKGARRKPKYDSDAAVLRAYEKHNGSTTMPEPKDAVPMTPKGNGSSMDEQETREFIEKDLPPPMTRLYAMLRHGDDRLIAVPREIVKRVNEGQMFQARELEDGSILYTPVSETPASWKPPEVRLDKREQEQAREAAMKKGRGKPKPKVTVTPTQREMKVKGTTPPPPPREGPKPKKTRVTRRGKDTFTLDGELSVDDLLKEIGGG